MESEESIELFYYVYFIFILIIDLFFDVEREKFKFI